MIRHVILRAMAYSIRAAVPGDEQTLFGLIEGLARYARLTHEVTGNASALRKHLFGARPAAEALLAEQSTDGAAEAVGLGSRCTSPTTPPSARGPASTWRISSWSTPTGGRASGGRCSPR
jgi:hypothetical protein